MHKFSTAAAKPSVLPALRSVDLLNVLYSTFAGASIARLVRPALSPLRDKNLCIIRAMPMAVSLPARALTLNPYMFCVDLPLEHAPLNKASYGVHDDHHRHQDEDPYEDIGRLENAG